ncbi:CAP domain-containing protein [Strongyloides ratti]|uniref:CAP domain-containing protein n=1 Tax=Strongyloides ratti TaxID=34506 RepID=A0A090LGM1_STRRB|nr:CAP domain-containing protein [Strongyloides ratti]CEF66660.1 CAP domain-containing protein [Strongyloides ratti]
MRWYSLILFIVTYLYIVQVDSKIYKINVISKDGIKNYEFNGKTFGTMNRVKIYIEQLKNKEGHGKKLSGKKSKPYVHIIKKFRKIKLVDVEKETKITDNKDNTEKPKIIDNKDITEKPKVIDNKDITEKPKVIDNKDKTEKPKVVDNKDKTEKPKVVDNKDKTEKPKVIDNKDNTEKPKVIDNKDKTEKPKVIDNKDKTEKPKVIDNKDNTEKPKVIDNKDKTEKPKVIDNKDKTEKPKVIDNKDKTEKPKVIDNKDDKEKKPTIQDVFLNQTNKYRESHQVKPLTINPEITAAAQAYAEKLAASGSFEHDTNTKYGENLYFHSHTPDDAVNSWYSEVRHYSFHFPIFSFSTGHFTALVWKSTKEMGCGTAKGKKGYYVVCKYSPPGNVHGKYSENVLAKKS